MGIDRRWRYSTLGLGKVVALTAAILIGLSASMDSAHVAFAADTPPGTDTSAAAPLPPVNVADLAAARRMSLQASAAKVDAQSGAMRLARHEDRERTAVAAINAEADRLRNLDKFAWPTKGGVSSGFGMRKHPILGYARLHDGADIGGACGNPIYAAQSGTVTKAGYGRSSGNNIRVDHGSIKGRNVQTAYLHMSRLAVRTGQVVDRGDVIGYVGTTGLSTACHLHLALYEDGTGHDPLDYLTKK